MSQFQVPAREKGRKEPFGKGKAGGRIHPDEAEPVTGTSSAAPNPLVFPRCSRGGCSCLHTQPPGAPQDPPAHVPARRRRVGWCATRRCPPATAGTGQSQSGPAGDRTHLISSHASSPLSISTSRSFVVSAARDRMSAISASSSFLRTCCTRSSCFLKGEGAERSDPQGTSRLRATSSP